MLGSCIGSQLAALAREIRRFGIGLRAHRNIFACRHGHCARDQAGDPGHQHIVTGGACCGYAQEQARGRDDPVIRPQHREIIVRITDVDDVIPVLSSKAVSGAEPLLSLEES
jgi:hypothetical protein